MNADDLLERSRVLAGRLFKNEEAARSQFEDYLDTYAGTANDFGRRVWVALLTWPDPDSEPDPDAVLSAFVRDWHERIFVAPIGGSSVQEDADPIKGKASRQVDAILKAAEELGFSLMAVPRGGKSQIMNMCLADPKMFTESSFDHAWKAARKLGLIKTEGHESYIARK
ncbi:MAG: hypothetical protein PHG21_03925 [Azoarcus sp.]|nr:hypothetical protein [Azoarcus sp.]